MAFGGAGRADRGFGRSRESDIGGTGPGGTGRAGGGRQGQPGGRSGDSRDGSGNQRDGNGVRRARRLRETSNQNELLSNRDTVATTPVDPEPQSADQIAARQAEVRRRGRGQTILSGRLGEAVGPLINRPRLGG